MKQYMTVTSKKRKIKKITDPDEPDTDYFKIEDHKITNLQSLINLIYDLINKNPPPKKIKKTLPIKLYKLIDIIEPLEKLNNMTGLEKLKDQLMEQLLYFVQDHNDHIMLHTVI